MSQLRRKPFLIPLLIISVSFAATGCSKPVSDNDIQDSNYYKGKDFKKAGQPKGKAADN